MSDERIPECAEKSRLMDEYSAALNEVSRTAGILNTRMGVMYKGDYERLSKAVDEARTRSEQLHQCLRNHIEEHGC